MNEPTQGATLSLDDILLTLRKHLKIIIGSTIIVTLLAFVVTFFVMTPKYEATTQVLVNRKLDAQDQGVQQLQQVQADVQMINTYKDIITSPTVLKDVVKKVDAGDTIGQLKDKITINSQQNSQVFSVSVKTTDPKQAALIANTTAQTFRNKIKSIMSVNNVSIVSKAAVNPKPVSPRLPMNLAIGFALGLLFGIGFAFLNEALDKTVKDENFFNEAGLTSLGIVSEIAPGDLKQATINSRSRHQSRHSATWRPAGTDTKGKQPRRVD